MLYQQVDFCPYCGADHPLDTVVRKRAEAPLKAMSPPISPPPAALSAPDVANPELPPVAPDQRQIHPLEAPAPVWQSAGRWIFTKGMLAVWFVLALAYAAYLLLGESRKQEPASDEPSTNSSGGSISPYPPQANLAPRAGTDGATAVAPKPRVMPQYKDVADSLRAARASLQDNNLSDAKAATHAALTREANNADALALERDIEAREQRRDGALQSADKCASERAWACVQQYASAALAVDASSVHAQTLMERMILSTGWSPPASLAAPSAAAVAPARAPRSAKRTGLPSSRDWGAAAPPAAPGGSTSTSLPPLPLATSMPPATTATRATPGAPAAPAAKAAAADEDTTSALRTAPAAAPAISAPASNDSSSNDNATSASGNSNTNNTTSTDSGTDAAERAIKESGWKHAAPSSAPR
ncbi:hypothetical protein GCM10027093_24040 [Paraburkholderia jirisanensis]